MSSSGSPVYSLPPDYQLPDPTDNKGPLLRRTVWVLISLSTVVVSFRVFSKLRKTRRLYWDDALMILALVSVDEILDVSLLSVA